jgi:hypothetical protein
VEENGKKKETVSSYSLIYSTWLKEVTAYSIEDVIVVIASIKEDQYSYFTKKYIFCGIPENNWSSFYYGLYDLNKSYGERFHKYIFDYKCNCD